MVFPCRYPNYPTLVGTLLLARDPKFTVNQMFLHTILIRALASISTSVFQQDILSKVYPPPYHSWCHHQPHIWLSHKIKVGSTPNRKIIPSSSISTMYTRDTSYMFMRVTSFTNRKTSFNYILTMMSLVKPQEAMPHQSMGKCNVPTRPPREWSASTPPPPPMETMMTSGVSTISTTYGSLYTL